MTRPILYQMAISHYCEKVRWALEYKSVPYKAVSLLPGFHTARAKKLTGASQLPILQLGDTVLNESSSILTFLDERYPQRSLMPADPGLQAEVTDWEQFADQEIGPHVRRVCYHTVLENKQTLIAYLSEHGPWYGKFIYAPLYPKLKTNMRKLMQISAQTSSESEVKLLQALEKIQARLSTQHFLVGDSFTRADLTVSALFAPLCQPESYPISWIKPASPPLSLFQARIGSSLDFVLNNYSLHRRAKA